MQSTNTLSFMSPCTTRICTKGYIVMRKKKKKSSSSSQGPVSNPPRITSKTKQSVQFLKELRGGKSTYTKRHERYCQKKGDKKDLPQDSEPYTHPRGRYYRNKVLCNLDADPVMLVDGYNVIFYWPELKDHCRNGRLQTARQLLVQELSSFTETTDFRVVVVFDALLSGHPTHKDNLYGVDIVYTGDSCADSWIENEVAVLIEDGCPEVLVATSDRLQQAVALGAGAYIWSSEKLISEIKTSKKELEMIRKEERYTSFQGRLLKHNLKSEVVDALRDMRNKLLENEYRS